VGFRGAENVFVVAHFPATASTDLAEMMGGAQLKVADKFAKIGGGLASLHQEVQVIRHQAISVEQEGMRCCGCEKRCEDGMGGLRVGKVRLP
jgi:hypothetical protein